ncbi:unnamed protein product [Tetraodon nigroviridis]|uniref:(spotted green pufferfish) hypothetical protein n=1 Tax=Tetraodon nigroviridis TaxID=99883 RepID=Q4T6C4_TETNG|nr:unnamed protein product [Tetraodon nigroviridis]
MTDMSWGFISSQSANSGIISPQLISDAQDLNVEGIRNI